MDWVTQTISSLGQSMGIPELALDAQGYALFALEADGSLCLQDLRPFGGEELLVILSKPLPAPPGVSARGALASADFRASLSWQMQLGLRDGDLRVTLRIPRPSFTLAVLEDALQTLFDFHARVAQEH